MPLRNPFREPELELPAGSEERRKVADALADPAAKLLVLAPRRNGKSLLLRGAAADAREDGVSIVRAALAGISCIADVASRILVSAAEELTPRWGDALTEIAKRLGVRVGFETDPASSETRPRIDPQSRRAPLEEQQALLRRSLDALDDLAREREARMAIALEDVDELFRLGGDSAVWALAGAARQHAHLAYVLSANSDRIPESAVGDASPLSFFESLSLVAISPVVLASWIDRQLQSSGIRANEAGGAITAVAGSCAVDCAQLAAYCFDSVRSSGYVAEDAIPQALEHLVNDVQPLIVALWGALTQHQQNVLRALAASSTGLTTAATRDRFSLGDTGTAHNSAQLLVRKGIIGRTDAGYVFTSPFVRAWVISHALPDAGVFLPITHVPTNPDIRISPL